VPDVHVSADLCTGGYLYTRAALGRPVTECSVLRQLDDSPVKAEVNYAPIDLLRQARRHIAVFMSKCVVGHMRDFRELFSFSEGVVRVLTHSKARRCQDRAEETVWV
jgi:hypothetical protein